MQWLCGGLLTPVAVEFSFIYGGGKTMAITISMFPQGGANDISGVISSLFKESKGHNNYVTILMTGAVIFLWAQVDTRSPSPAVCAYVDGTVSVTGLVHRKFHFQQQNSALYKGLDPAA